MVTVAARDPERAGAALGAARKNIRILCTDLADPAALDALLDAARPAIFAS